jgi:hypothetical protein
MLVSMMKKIQWRVIVEKTCDAMSVVAVVPMVVMVVVVALAFISHCRYPPDNTLSARMMAWITAVGMVTVMIECAQVDAIPHMLLMMPMMVSMPFSGCFSFSFRFRIGIIFLHGLKHARCAALPAVVGIALDQVSACWVGAWCVLRHARCAALPAVAGIALDPVSACWVGASCVLQFR